MGKIGIHGTMAADIPLALEDLHEKVRTIVKGVFGAIVIDSATTYFVGGASVHGILFVSSQLVSPLLIDAVVVDESFVAERYAEAIEAACGRFGISLDTQVTCIMGDNAYINDKIARLLNITLAKCIAHSLNLVSQDLTAEFQHCEDVTTVLVGIISAGGSKIRAKELKALGIKISAITAYKNRWSSIVAAAKYMMSPSDNNNHISNYEVIKEWFLKRCESAAKKAEKSVARKVPSNLEHGSKHATKTARKCPQVIAEETEMKPLPKRTDECGIEKGILTNAVCARLKNAFSTPTSMVELCIVCMLHEDIPALIKMASGNGDAVDASFLDAVKSLGISLESTAKLSRARLLVTECMTECHIQSEKTQSVHAMFTNKVINAAKAGYAKFLTHTSIACDLLQQRFRFDQRRHPVPLDLEPFDELSPETIKKFFGCLKEDAGFRLVKEYDDYVATYPLLTIEEKSMSPSQFWKSKLDKYKILSKLGMWWAEVPTSSVAIERVFGVMRAMEDPQRCNLTVDNFKAELFFKINKAVLR